MQPYRLANLDRVNQFYALLSTFPHLEWISVTLEIADLAAQLRADHSLKTPDAIQAATAIVSHATGFISNDKTFRRVPRLDVFILDEAHATKRPGTR